MITPDEIKKKALGKYNKFLVAGLKGKPFFPLTIPGNKGKTTDELGKRMKELKLLWRREKSKVGFGYTVEEKNVRTRASGVQSKPARIYFETESDYLKFLGRTKEFKAFEAAVAIIRNALPELNEWVIENPGKIIKNLGKWGDLMKVCVYFRENPEPGMYIRELPIEVHTKFIEDNKRVLKNLLDHLLPEEMVNHGETDFEKRFGLKFKEPMVRLRILDPGVAESVVHRISDLSLPLSEFSMLDLRCRNVFIVENEMNFLAFPSIPDSLVIFGKGKAVGMLACVDWLRNKAIIYSGDMDEDGFQILSSLRGSFKQTVSMMMDMETFVEFENFAVKGPDRKTGDLNHLTRKENELFRMLRDRSDRNRLEQEKIPHGCTIRKLAEMGFETIPRQA